MTTDICIQKEKWQKVNTCSEVTEQMCWGPLPLDMGRVPGLGPCSVPESAPPTPVHYCTWLLALTFYFCSFPYHLEQLSHPAYRRTRERLWYTNYKIGPNAPLHPVFIPLKSEVNFPISWIWGSFYYLLWPIQCSKSDEWANVCLSFTEVFPWMPVNTCEQA